MAMNTRHIFGKLGVTGLILLGAASAAWADRLTLKTGTVVEGTFLGGTARQVRMEVNGQVQNYNVDEIRSIGFRDSTSSNNNQGNNNQGAYQNSQQQYPPNSQQQYPSSSQQQYPANSQQQQQFPQTAATRSNSGNYSNSRVGVTIPADTTITIRMIDNVNSESARLGQSFKASLDEPIYANGQQVVPRGADVMTKIVDDQRAGKLSGRSSLTLALSQIMVDGRYVDVTSTDVETEAGSQTGRTAKVVGGTAALGAIIGAIAGGGKGAAIGAGSGAAVGGAATIMTSGPKVNIPSETRLTFKLQAPISW
ncbi:MAG: hypothetical protein JWN34_1281 [Bryobacterales bacterium]|nr:hypothetical protein [Bryobacterales bacterium]